MFGKKNLFFLHIEEIWNSNFILKERPLKDVTLVLKNNEFGSKGIKKANYANFLNG